MSTYVPDIIKAFREQAVAEQAAPAPAAETATSPAPVAAAGNARAASAPGASASPMGPLAVVLALVAVVAIAFAAPFLMGFENIIGVVIIAIGLYEAWKINRKPDRTVTGPFRIEDAASGGTPVESTAP